MILDAPLQSICKCHFCSECDGTGCIGEMPGMGGFSQNVNFIRNCADWAVVEEEIKNLGNKEYTKLLSAAIPVVRLAPITGGIENVGYSTEKGFYKDIIAAVYKAGCKLSIGDGCPDIKLLSGIEAVKSLSSSGAVGAGAGTVGEGGVSEPASVSDTVGAGAGSVSSAVSETVASGEYASFGSTGADFALGEGVSSGVTGSVCASSGTTNPPPKAAVFIKPYPQSRIFERVEWSAPVAEYIGVDIDSYSILTMRNLVKLEKKTASQLIEIKKEAANKGIPFAVKGVFTREDVELMQEVRPDVIVISNHGGRVENRAGSSAVFMAKNAATLRGYCGELWVDGGIRKYRDLQTAAYFGISQVMIGRPFISALCRGGSAEVRLAYEKLINPTH